MRVVIGLVAALAAAGAAAQDYPNRPVTMVVGFAPGGGGDITGRTIAKKFGDYLGQNVVVENRSGAGGNIAAAYVAKATPDGYTLFLGNVGALTVAPSMNTDLPYDPLRDFAPISLGVVFANVVVVHPSVKAKTLAEYVKEANSRPGGMPYGTSGVGSAGHLAGELFKMMAKANLVHVPYKGGGPAMSDLLGGQVPSLFASAPTAVPNVKSGRIRALATTGPKRSASFPDVPTIAESGFPGYEATNWYGLVAPAKTPKEIIDRVHAAFTKALTTPDVRDQLLSHGEEPTPTSPEEFGKFMQREITTWARVVKDAHIQAE
jgi:tripartite-type tricarboxylate transporter receptor subunit TctC